MATVTTSANAVLPTTGTASAYPVARNLLLVTTATEYTWLTAGGDRITLFGSFTYPGGTAADPAGSVTQVRWDTGNTGITDLTIVYDAPASILSGLLNGNGDVFWRTALGEQDFAFLSGSAPGSTADFSLGIGLDGSNPVSAQADFADISGIGAYSGDALRGGLQYAADTITYSRSLSGQTVITGDAGFVGAGTAISAATADDTITDNSTLTGETVLIGDIGSVGAFFTITGGADTITGGSTPATLVGDVYVMVGSGVAAPTVTGGADRLTGGSANDIIVGDVYDVDNGGASAGATLIGGSDIIVGGAGDDRIYGEYLRNVAGMVSGGDDLIEGGTGNDIIFGQTGSDRIGGGAGNDVLSGGAGNDTIDGDGGSDTAIFSTSPFAVTVSLGLVGADGSATGNGSDTLREIENVVGSALGDTITGNELANVIEGGAGNDTLAGGAGVDTASYAAATAAVTVSLALTSAQNTGGAGTDTLSGFENLRGSAHADSLTGNAAANVLTGGLGNDRYFVDSAADTVIESAGGGIGDYIFATASYTAAAHTERLYLQGSSDIDATGRDGQADLLVGNSGSNRLDGKSGQDILIGGAGNDIYFVDQQSDRVIENAGEGTDFVFTTASHQLSENAERLIAVEGAADAYGLTARNFQNDIIIGNSSTNVFVDQFGRDIFVGGGGADFFRFIANLDPVNNVNRINDFDPADDQFQLQQTIYSQIGIGILSAAQFVVGTAATDSNDRIIYDSPNGVLYYDPDGTGAAVQIEIVNVTAGTPITADDFQIF